MESQGLVRRGVRWKIGSGNNVAIWSSPWIRDDQDFFIRTPCPEGLEDLKVSDLIKSEGRFWDVHILNALFMSREFYSRL